MSIAILARPRNLSGSTSVPSAGARRCKRKFLRFFPGGFTDETYYAWERDYKFNAHTQWTQVLGREQLRHYIRSGNFIEAAAHAVRIESRTNLLFSFEKMALRDAVRSDGGAKLFARGLEQFLYGAGSDEHRFVHWVDAVAALPRKQTRVLTWPLLTVFPFLAEPKQHIFLKPNVTRIAAREYGFEFDYRSKPNFQTYRSLLDFADKIRRDLRDDPRMKAKDMIDLQSFMWVQGSDEYE